MSRQALEGVESSKQKRASNRLDRLLGVLGELDEVLAHLVDRRLAGCEEDVELPQVAFVRVMRRQHATLIAAGARSHCNLSAVYARTQVGGPYGLKIKTDHPKRRKK